MEPGKEREIEPIKAERDKREKKMDPRKGGGREENKGQRETDKPWTQK